MVEKGIIKAKGRIISFSGAKESPDAIVLEVHDSAEKLFQKEEVTIKGKSFIKHFMNSVEGGPNAVDNIVKMRHGYIKIEIIFHS